jgi:hypothetical protein
MGRCKERFMRSPDLPYIIWDGSINGNSEKICCVIEIDKSISPLRERSYHKEDEDS